MATSDDFWDFINEQDEAKRAQRNGSVPGYTPLPPGAIPSARTGDPDFDKERKYALRALEIEAGELSALGRGSRNDRLNKSAYKLAGKFIPAGTLSANEIYQELYRASEINGHVREDGPMAHNTLVNALGAGADKPVQLNVDWHQTTVGDGFTVEETSAEALLGGAAPAAANEVMPGRELRWKTADKVRSAVPVWAWTYGGKGRIQLGTLALFAGRPGVGKSTAARWLVAEATNGRLDGCWRGQPQNVAYIATEEPEEYTVVPSLLAAGADLSRVHFPKAYTAGQEALILSALDEQAIVQYLLDHDIRIVVVDALMTTVGAINVNQNNEVRAMVTPWTRIAEKIHGIVIGVSHLRKAPGGDVVAAINGSSAFGEVARSIFGFAKNPATDQRVMSQHKNSTGFEDLSLSYELQPTAITVSTGEATEITKFVITGESDMTVEDILAEATQVITSLDEAKNWLEDYLSINGPHVPSQDVKRDGGKLGHSESTLKRASKKLRVLIESHGMPRTTVWSLPEPPRSVGRESGFEPDSELS